MMRIHSLLVSALLTVSAAAQGLGTVFTLGNEPTGNTVRV